MTGRRASGGWVIVASFVVAFVLTAMPLPDWAQYFRPAWVALVLAYWCMALPERIGIVSGWCVGILLDVMTGSLLGQHAMGLAILAYVVVSYHKRLRVFSLVQQAAVIGFVLGVYVLLLNVIDIVAGLNFRLQAFAGVVTSMLLWPWVFVLLRDMRRRGGVA